MFVLKKKNRPSHILDPKEYRFFSSQLTPGGGGFIQIYKVGNVGFLRVRNETMAKMFNLFFFCTGLSR